MKLLLINQPEQYNALLGMNPSELLCGKNEIPDLIHLFAETYSAFENRMKKIGPLIRKNRRLVIWVSWYKKTAQIPTDITEDRIRRFALMNELVDVKVCSVSEMWSGLKLVVPLLKR